MMTYPAPDGHIIESLPYPQEVTYNCECVGYEDGIYDSLEVKGAPTEIGIQGIKIKRFVDSNVMNIIIIEFSEQELIDYKNSGTLPSFNF
jgi:hypothetical protein